MGDRSPKYNRILLKLSGEALGGARDYGIDVPYQSPTYKSMEKQGNKIVLTFDHVDGGFFRYSTTADWKKRLFLPAAIWMNTGCISKRMEHWIVVFKK